MPYSTMIFSKTILFPWLDLNPFFFSPFLYAAHHNDTFLNPAFRITNFNFYIHLPHSCRSFFKLNNEPYIHFLKICPTVISSPVSLGGPPAATRVVSLLRVALAPSAWSIGPRTVTGTFFSILAPTKLSAKFPSLSHRNEYKVLYCYPSILISNNHKV